MNPNANTPRYLGAAFLGVILTSLVSGVATSAATGSGGVSSILQSVSNNAGTMRIAVLAGMLNAAGILILATLLYVVLRGQGRTMALVALLCWVGESFFYALNQIAATGLITLGNDFTKAGMPDHSFYQTLGTFLYNDVYKLGGIILMFFYCAGGLLYYYLFFKSGFVPRWLSGYGLAAVTLGLVGAGVEFLGTDLGLMPFIAVGPFELIIGSLLLFRGIKRWSPVHASLLEVGEAA
ncbi:MAG: DUF4386 domain-containing protein [Candidatus Limnocylindrales bacterium]